MISKIESVQNEKIKAAVKLSQSSKARFVQSLFFLEGLRLCMDALNSSLSVDTVFFTAEFAAKHTRELAALCDAAQHVYAVSEPVANKLSQTETPQGVFCLVRSFPTSHGQTISVSGKYIALEQIRDPSNLGAVCRTAEALGIDGAILCGCCDVFNPKALRASMGSLLRLPLFLSADLPALLAEKKAAGMRIYAATPSESASPVTDCSMSGGVTTVIGNEANGVTAQTLSVCQPLTIPMLGRAESLNASMAAAIMMWEMMRSDR